MNELFLTLGRTTVLLALSALVVAGLLRLLHPRSPQIHRMAWASVLLQGWLIFGLMSLEIPWYEPAPAQPTGNPDLAVLDVIPEYNIPSERNEIAAANVPPLVPSSQFNSRQPKWTPGQALGFVWFTGMLGMVSMTSGSYVFFLYLLRTSETASEEFQQEWKRLLGESHVHRKIPLLVHESLGPMLCRLPVGYRVVVPAELWNQFGATQRIAILRHELAHFRRGDIWTSLAVRLIALPHWFNPCAWWAVRKFEEGGEWACDQQLADAAPRQVPDYARALLEIVEPRSRWILAPAARGSSLNIRLRRLLAVPTKGDSIMKRLLFGGTLLGLVVFGLLRFQLVAQEADERDADAREEVEQEYQQEIKSFASSLPTDDALPRQLKDALATKAGRIVLQDRAFGFEEREREEARTEAIPVYIEEHFERKGDRYQLREDQSDYRAGIIRATAGFNEDVDRITPVVKEHASKMATDSELEKLVARFLNHEAAATFLYVRELRERLRPSVELVADRLGELFVADENGQYVIRASRRAEAEKAVRRGKEMFKALGELKKELKLWAEDVSQKDDFHKMVKREFASSSFASMVASEILDFEGDGSASERVDEFFDGLENATKDTGGGLVVRNEERKKIEEFFENYKRRARMAKKLAGPLKEFASNIRTGDELANGFREILNTDVAAMKFADEFEAAASPEDAVRLLLSEVLVAGDNGRLTVSPEHEPEEVEEFIGSMFRAYREVRRKGRVLDRLAANLDDQELAAAFSTVGGKLIVAQSIRQKVAMKRVDGLSLWINEYFEQVDDGLALREGADEEVRAILEETAELKKELAKDDF